MLIMIDLDNTLGDRSAAVVKWADEFCTAHALGPTDRDWLIETDNDGYSRREDVFTAIKQRYALTDSVDELVMTYRSRIVEMTTPLTGAHECLVRLRAAGHRIAIVTNGSSGQQHGKIDTLGFRELVDAVIVSGDVNIKKPDRRIFDAAAAATASSLDDAWMVGDSVVNDVVGPQALGVKTVWIRRGRTWPVEYVSPTAIVDTLAELVPLIA